MFISIAFAQTTSPSGDFIGVLWGLFLCFVFIMFLMYWYQHRREQDQHKQEQQPKSGFEALHSRPDKSPAQETIQQQVVQEPPPQGQVVIKTYGGQQGTVTHFYAADAKKMAEGGTFRHYKLGLGVSGKWDTGLSPFCSYPYTGLAC